MDDSAFPHTSRTYIYGSAQVGIRRIPISLTKCADFSNNISPTMTLLLLAELFSSNLFIKVRGLLRFRT